MLTVRDLIPHGLQVQNRSLAAARIFASILLLGTLDSVCIEVADNPPDICSRTLQRYFLMPESVETIMVKPYCFCAEKSSEGYTPR